jgi:Tol biopolymer transport system component
MRGTTVAGAIALAVCLRAPVDEPAGILLTVPQRDGWRSGTNLAPAGLSADGRWVAFESYARLAPADTNNQRDIYVLDRTTGRVTLESLTSEGEVLDGDSGYPRLSGNGQCLVFETTILQDGAPSGNEILLRDRTRHTTTALSRGALDRRPGHVSRGPAISEDGRVVVFASNAVDLVPGPDANGAAEDVYLFEVATGAVRRISLDVNGLQPADGASYAPSVSADGRYVAFTSKATLDGPRGRSPSGRQIASVYVRDTLLGATERISVAAKGAAANRTSSDPSISADGNYVAFVSEATNLAPGDRHASPDILLRDRRARSTVVISRAAGGGAANGPSRQPVVSADGRFVAFQSQASNLVCAKRCAAADEDINLVSDVFVFDRVTGTTVRISAGPEGGWAEESAAPQFDAGAGVVAFTSRHPIDERDVSNDFDLFVRVRDAPAGTAR